MRKLSVNFDRSTAPMRVQITEPFLLYLLKLLSFLYELFINETKKYWINALKQVWLHSFTWWWLFLCTHMAEIWARMHEYFANGNFKRKICLTVIISYLLPPVYPSHAKYQCVGVRDDIYLMNYVLCNNIFVSKIQTFYFFHSFFLLLGTFVFANGTPSNCSS